MNLKEVSQRTKIAADTIRYYERLGLIPAIKRKENGIRDFNEQDILRILFTKQMCTAELSLESLIDYWSLFQQGTVTVNTRVQLLIDQKVELQARINLLEEAKIRLDGEIQQYSSYRKSSIR